MTDDILGDVDRSVRTVDLRLAIAVECGFADAFRERVARSDSHSLAAIYLHATELRTVADALAIAQVKSECNSQTRKIRRARQYEEIPDDV